jgi:N-dimethylarginine dimethylaminohydrolase
VSTSSFPIVNSHNGWSKLEEVVLGSAFHLDYSNDVSFRLFFHQNLMKEPYADSSGRWEIFEQGPTPSNRMRDELTEDLVGFRSILEDFGTIVRSPETLTDVKVVQTPDWKAPMGHALMPRDILLVIGNEIIETAPMVRARYFETNLYKPLLMEYFRAGAKWTVAPRSRLRDENFDYSFVSDRGYDGPIPAEHAYEIMFDGAQVLRLGRDLVFNTSTENHALGAEWLQRHLGDTYRVHRVAITDNHIDSSVIALRPGTLLAQVSLDVEELPEPIRSWDVIRYEAIDASDVDHAGLPLLASQNIGINVLSLDEQTVVVQDIQTELIAELERRGFTPIPCRWRHGRTVGGGFHCLTLDVRRQSVLEDYLEGAR